MAQRSIREYDSKMIFSKHWKKYFDGFNYGFQSVLVSSGEELLLIAQKHGFEWLNQKALVAKPDMLFGKRGLNNLVLFKKEKPGDINIEDVASWIDEKKQGECILHSGQKGKLTHFIVEPFTPHTQEQEYYICATTLGKDDVLYLSAEGGVDIEDGWNEKVAEVVIPITLDERDIEHIIRANTPPGIAEDIKEHFITFVEQFYKFFRDMNFSYLEINPMVIIGNEMHILDLVARLDDTAGFFLADDWCNVTFPTPFGGEIASPEEEAIAKADAKSGASLKLSVLNPMGRIWTMVAGGGASVVYADTIADLSGNVADLANYGEYSGGPSADESEFYANTILDLMTRRKDAKGRDKILIIGGAIANFTDVASTFGGIIKALEKYAPKLNEIGTRIYVRRGGPNYEQGLKNIQEAGDRLGLNMQTYGPSTHITDIVRIALEK